MLKSGRVWYFVFIFIAGISIQIEAVGATQRTVSGQVFIFTSHYGKEEQCVILDKMPSAKYSGKDTEKENFYCTLDLYNDPQIGICPKTWSTSPGTVLYNLVDSTYNNDREGFESQGCRSARSDDSIKSIGKIKQTMNAVDTSGTFSTSSLLYYHFSRFFDTSVSVPVAVYREMDKDEHLNRVALKGQSSTAYRGGMNNAAWNHFVEADRNPSSYRPTSELFTIDRKKVYGAFLKGPGTRYGPEINGIRSKWGMAQNYDFQDTPAFKALRTNGELEAVIVSTLRNYSSYISSKRQQYARVEKVTTVLSYLEKVYRYISVEQMIFWMKDLSEIAIFDFIFSQQDRVGNIDFKWYWYWVDAEKKIKRQKVDSKVPRVSMRRISTPPDEIKEFNPVLLQRTMLVDNDAGGRYPYQNYSRKTKMVENLRHINPKTYRKLIQLNNDLQSKGEIYDYIVRTFGLSDIQINQIVVNTNKVVTRLKATCHQGELRFDLKPGKFLKGEPISEDLDCDNP